MAPSNIYPIVMLCMLGLLLLLYALCIRSFIKYMTTFKIASRNPALALLSTCFSILIVTATLLEQASPLLNDGWHLSCALFTILGHMHLPLYGLPYIRRGLQLVILYHDHLRLRFGHLVRRLDNTCYLVCVLVICHAGTAALDILYSDRQSRPCHMMRATWFFCAMLGFYGGAMLAITWSLAKSPDIFGLRDEFFGVFFTWLFLATIHLTCFLVSPYSPALVDFQRDHNLFALVLLVTHLVTSILTITFPLLSLTSEDKIHRMRIPSSEPAPVSAARWREDMENTGTSKTLAILQHPEAAVQFELFAQQALCPEAVSFCLGVLEYKKLTDVGTQWLAFSFLFEKYVKEGSREELILSSAHRKRVLEVFSASSRRDGSTVSGLFPTLDGSVRLSLFDDIMGRVMYLLSTNLTRPFMRTKEYRDLREPELQIDPPMDTHALMIHLVITSSGKAADGERRSGRRVSCSFPDALERTLSGKAPIGQPT